MRWKPIRKRREPVDRVAASFAAPQTDPFGTWTGVPADADERPVQDADDL